MTWRALLRGVVKVDAFHAAALARLAVTEAEPVLYLAVLAAVVWVRVVARVALLTRVDETIATL